MESGLRWGLDAKPHDGWPVPTFCHSLLSGMAPPLAVGEVVDMNSTVAVSAQQAEVLQAVTLDIRESLDVVNPQPADSSASGARLIPPDGPPH